MSHEDDIEKILKDHPTREDAIDAIRRKRETYGSDRLTELEEFDDVWEKLMPKVQHLPRRAAQGPAGP